MHLMDFANRTKYWFSTRHFNTLWYGYSKFFRNSGLKMYFKFRTEFGGKTNSKSVVFTF